MTHATGAPFDSGWQHEIRAAFDAAGLPRIHSPRNRTATPLLQGGENFRLVATLLGHPGIGLTLLTFAHALPIMHGGAANAMAGMLSG